MIPSEICELLIILLQYYYSCCLYNSLDMIGILWHLTTGIWKAFTTAAKSPNDRFLDPGYATLLHY